MDAVGEYFTLTLRNIHLWMFFGIVCGIISLDLCPIYLRSGIVCARISLILDPFFHSGTLFVTIGPSGSGKTTLVS